MADDKTWSMQDMDKVFPALPAAKQPEPTLNEIAEAQPKPAHHNSKFKAALLLGGGVCLAVVAALLFTLTGSKTPEKVIATAPETTQPAATSNDGWDTAAKQSTSDAGQSINLGDKDKKPSTTESPTPSTSPSTVSKNEATPSPSASTSPAAATQASPAAVTKPKPAVAPPAPEVAQAPKVTKPVATVKQKVIADSPAPKPVAIARSSPKPVASTAPKPSPSVKPLEVVQAPKPAASPSPAPSAKTEPTRVTPRETLASNKPEVTPASWEQASNLGVYGGDPSESVVPKPVGGLGTPVAKDAGVQARNQRSSYEGAMSPTLLMAAGTNVKGHTLAPYSAGVSDKQSDEKVLTVVLDEPIELSKGYRLPVGTTVNFTAIVRDNGSVVATSKNADINGVEITLPEGAITLAAGDNGLLMAKEISTGEGDLARADTSSSLWGGAASAGKAILQSNSQTTSQTGLLGTTTQTTNGSPNIIGAVLDGAFSPLASNGQKRAQQKADQIQKRTKLHAIDVNTKVKLFVNVPVQVQIPVSGQQVAQEVEQEAPPPRLISSNSVQVPVTEQLPAPSLNPTPLPTSPQSATPQQPTTLPISLKPQKPPMSESE
jgi:hypothetical protein